jgi:Rieske Fe-S protein
MIGAAAVATFAGPALAVLADPLMRRTSSSPDAFLPAGKPSLFSGDEPVKVDLFADKVDGWNRVEQVKVGSAWVMRHGGKLVALSTICPHLGCGVDYDPNAGKFLCPCHKSWFALDGSVESGPSPRGLDPLELKADDQLVAIRYRRYKTGVAEQEPA